MFKIEQGELFCVNEGSKKSLTSVLAEYQSPTYLYDLIGLKKRAENFLAVLPKKSKAYFAMKSNSNPKILKVLKESGYGVDVVSGGELKRALECGFTPDQIVFSGVGKTQEELTEAIHLSVLQINVESLPELNRIIIIARQLKKPARIALRINPDVEAKTHPYITTGFRENKFGVDLSQIPDFVQTLKRNKEFVNFVGITLHIGSQIREANVFAQAAEKALQIYAKLKAEGFDLRSLDLGGGVGIDYHSDGATSDEAEIQKYGEVIRQVTKNFNDQLYFEPGRILTARFGVLVTQVQYVKITPYKKFVIVDTGMNHLLRPALYQAHHRILPVKTNPIVHKEELFDVVGPICESSDVLGHERLLPSDIKEGDFLAIMDAGAYGFVMSSQYNLHAAPKEEFL